MKIDNWTVNPKVTEDVIVEAVERYRSSLDNPGFCLCCGSRLTASNPMPASTSARPAARRRCTAPRSC